MKKGIRIGLKLLGCASLLLAQAQAALAHPLGNFTINRYTRIELASGKAELVYIADRAEIPALQERPLIDTDGDGSLSSAEQNAYLQRSAQQLQPGLVLSLDGGAPVALVLKDAQLSFPPGQGGLATQRITLRFAADGLPASAQVDFEDHTFAGRLGWQEIVVQAGKAVRVSGDHVPVQDISQGLTRYPQDLLTSPLAVSSVHFTVSPAPAAAVDASAAPASASAAYAYMGTGASTDAFATLITMPELGVGTVLLALLAAFGWGALHALSPGHGKTIVAAYLVGTRATALHALFLGVTTTLTHTAGVFIMGLVTLLAAQYVLPEQLFPWLEVASGALVVVLGASLLGGRLRKALGLVAPGAHTHADGAVQPGELHDHGDGFAHRHTVPQGRVTWRSLLALGVSGGLLPCPSALVVMLSAIGLHRVGFGLVLILSFSLGLACVLIAIGMALIHARALLDRFGAARWAFARPALRFAPVISATLITAAGALLTVRALVATGMLRL